VVVRAHETRDIISAGFNVSMPIQSISVYLHPLNLPNTSRTCYALLLSSGKHRLEAPEDILGLLAQLYPTRMLLQRRNEDPQKPWHRRFAVILPQMGKEPLKHRFVVLQSCHDFVKTPECLYTKRGSPLRQTCNQIQLLAYLFIKPRLGVSHDPIAC
jgi:hypothetical protein